MFHPSVIPVATDARRAAEREWERMATPGTWFSGEARVALADAGRRALDGEDPRPSVLSEPAAEAAQAIAEAPEHITPEWIDDLEARGLDRFAYVEIVGIIARLTAVDTLARGVGSALPALPDPVPGEPSRELPGGAGRANAWIPTVGKAAAPTALTAVPAEHAAQEDVHTGFYLGYRQMPDLAIVRDGVHRTQMELLAARTSYLNDCFY